MMRNNYVLIDFENITPDNLDLLDPEWVKVFLFVGKNQTKIPIALAKSIHKLGERAQYVEMAGTGHNALDFHIAYYIGRISVTDKTAFFHIISNDTGFDPLIVYLKQENIYADRVASIEEIPALIQVRVGEKTLDERIAFAKERLLRPNATRPRTRKTLSSHIAAMFLKMLSEEEITSIVEGLIENNCIHENGTRLVYSDEGN